MNIIYEQRERQLQTYPYENLVFYEHLHKETEIILIQEGALHIKIGNTQRCIKAGGAAIIFPNLMHSYYSEGSSKGNLILLGMQMVGDYESLLTGYICENPFLDKDVLPADVTMCINSLIREELNNHISLMRGYTAVLLGNLFNVLTLEKKKNSERQTSIGKLLDYITTHYREPLTLEIIASKTGIGKYTLSRVFNQELNCGLNEYLNSMRIGYAQHLLANQHLPITEIAYESGFSSLRTFNRVFQETHHISPRKYREKLIWS